MHLIRTFLYRLPELLFGCRPSGRLIRAGNHKHNPDIMSGFPESQYFQRSQCIKAACTAAKERSVTAAVGKCNFLRQSIPDLWEQRLPDHPVSGETDSRARIKITILHQSIFRTARKASLGTCTVPNWRIRFLPSFCFSSSFFFRVISPP